MQRSLLVLFFCVTTTACGRTACAAGQLPDRPVPADEPRATLVVKVDLARAGDCDERFDLALYQDRGVDLVTWEPPSGKCEGRRITVRYLPKRLKREALLQSIQKLSLKAEVVQ